MSSNTSPYFENDLSVNHPPSKRSSISSTSSVGGTIRKKQKNSRHELTHRSNGTLPVGKIEGDTHSFSNEDLPDADSLFFGSFGTDKTPGTKTQPEPRCQTSEQGPSSLPSPHQNKVFNPCNDPNHAAGPIKPISRGSEVESSSFIQEKPEATSLLPSHQQQQTHSRHVTRPSLPSKIRLASFLHFSRSTKPTITNQDFGSENRSDMSNGMNSPSSHQLEFRTKLSTKPTRTQVRWEQEESIWAPESEYNHRIHITSRVAEGSTFKNPSKDFDVSQDLNTNKSKSKPDAKRSRSALTQLEQQWLGFKKKHPELILLMEVGYKMRLFGSDAVLASKVLSIAHLSKSTLDSTFFPKTNLRLHLKRLVAAGHRVGIITQSETKALKDHGQKPNTLFERKLSGVYSLATWTEFDADTDPSCDPNSDLQPIYQTWIMSLYEERPKKRDRETAYDKVKMSMVALCPQNGDIIWDAWEDGRMRSRLETILLYFNPHEIVLPLDGLSRPSENLINWLIRHQHSSGSSSTKTRLETIAENFDVKTAFDFVTSFCQSSKKHYQVTCPDLSEPQDTSGASPAGGDLMQHIIELPDRVLMPLAGVITHMKSYYIDNILRHSTCFKPFSSHSHMTLNANTLSNLEIYHNSTDGREYGSLMWILDHTKTPMGKRLLKQWVGKPLIDFTMLKQRCEAVHEIVTNKGNPLLIKMRHLLRGKVYDLEKSLVRIQYRKCTEVELLKFLDTMLQISARFLEEVTQGPTALQSDLLRQAFRCLPTMHKKLIQYRSELDGAAISRGDLHNMFKPDEEKYPQINEMQDCLGCLKNELEEHLIQCRVIISNPELQYLTVGSDELLLEVRTQRSSSVPKDWIEISRTKAVHRYRTPQAQAMLEERERCQDLLTRIVDGYFQGFLKSLEEDYEDFRNIINHISILDCLMSLATASVNNNYSKPLIVDYPVVDVKQARHPMVEQLLDDPFVDNDVYIGQDDMTTMVLTGNNMGGKSVTSKMIACIIIMAQIGCYVPAEHATIGIFDACFTRMGMSDELGRGRSSFMVELMDTSSILRAATPRSFVIVDELGYGTSTHDGTAIASAVLHHLVSQIRCFTLFITHYPQMNEIVLTHPRQAKSYYMNYIETRRSDGQADITFLYKLTPGVACKSHGINVARLAGFPASVLQTAHGKSEELEEEATRRDISLKRQRIRRLLRALKGKTLDRPEDIVRQARLLIQHARRTVSS